MTEGTYRTKNIVLPRRFCLLGALLAGLALRVLRLTFQPLWWDEGYSVWFAGHSLPEMVRLTSLDIHPPLYYALLHGWTGIFGMSPVALRLMSVAVGLLTLPLAYRLGMELWGPREGCIAAWIVAAAPFHVYYSQEVRMYGLVTLLGMGAALFAWRYFEGRGKLWTLVWYTLFALASLYTQYYAAFVWLTLAAYGYLVLDGRRRTRWTVAQAGVLLAYVPWLVYALPRLIPYVRGKVVLDADRPLGPGAYLARHLAAFAIGHLDGPLHSLWPLGLLPWFLLLILLRRRDRSAGFVASVLGVSLVLGFLVNLKFPFAPVHGERLLLLAAPFAWLLLSRAISAISHKERMAALAAVFAISAVGLWALYTVPRYPKDDYRPLVARIQEQAAPGDVIFCIYPWQVGYWWSYGSRPDVVAVPTADASWGDDVKSQIDDYLSHGHGVWFPEHEALGAILESHVEQYLLARATPLCNVWYGETRLTAWTSAKPDAPGAAETCFEDGLCLVRSEIGPTVRRAENSPLAVALTWRTKFSLPEDLTVGLRLVDSAGNLWSQHDASLENGSMKFSGMAPGRVYEDRRGLIVPAGAPPGEYDLRLVVYREKSGKPVSVLGPQGRPIAPDVLLGKVKVEPQERPLPESVLPVQRRMDVGMGDGIRFVGYTLPKRTLSPGYDIPLTLFWSAAEVPRDDLTAFVQLLSGKKLVAAWEGPPSPGFSSTTWPRGYLVREPVRLHLPPTLKDGRYRLIVGMYRNGDRSRLRARFFLRSSDHVSLGEIAVRGRPHRMEPYRTAHPLEGCFGDLACLQGYDLDVGGGRVKLALQWHVVGTTDTRYSVFVHAVGPSGQILAIGDGEPGGGKAPTSTWLPGEYVLDEHVFPKPSGENWRLEIGFYDPKTGRRLPLLSSGGGIAGDHVTIVPGE